MKKPAMRFWIAVMVFWITFTNYMGKLQFNVSLPAMIKFGKHKKPPVCDKDRNMSAKSKTDPMYKFEKHPFTENEQGYLISGYGYGYIITVAPAGIVSEILGPTAVVVYTSLLSAVLLALGPVSTTGGSFAGLLSNRILTGLCGGFAYPAASCLIARWAPPAEKGKFVAAMMGNALGSVIMFPVIGACTRYLGWPFGFYVCAIVMGLFAVACAIVCSDSPTKHRWISQEELEFIVKSQEGKVSTTKTVPPYLKILTSFRVWAMFVAQFTNLWALNLLGSYAVKYMKETLGFDIQSSAGLSALPYLARFLMGFGFGFLGDWMQKKQFMSLTKLRKFFIIFSHLIPGVAMFLVRVCACNSAAIIALLVICQGFNGAVTVSHMINGQDLAPNYAATLYGLMNLLGQTTNFIVPNVDGKILTDYPDSLTGPAIIFMIGGILLLVGGVFFILFASGETQSWNAKKKDIAQPETS